MKIKTITLKEIGKKADQKKAARIKKGRWGKWYLSKDRKEIVINRMYPYSVTLKQIESDGLIHWLAHIREKSWLKRGDLEDLMQLFEDMFDIPNCLAEIYGYQKKGV